MLNLMVEYLEAAPTRLDLVFHALGDATRRRMLQALAGGERTVGQLAEPFAMSLAGASKHVRTLEQAGLLHREVRGRMHLCRLDAGPLADVHQWLSTYESFWTQRLDVLERLLREADASGPPPAPAPAATPPPVPPEQPSAPSRSPASSNPRPPRKKGPRR